MCAPYLQTITSVEKQELDCNNMVNKKDEEHVNTKKWKKCNLHSKYLGTFLENNLHGFGYYFHIAKFSYLYEGALYCNRIEGYGNITYSNCLYFEGLFKENRKFGPGILTDANNCQEVAWWNGSQIIRLLQRVLPNIIPKLKQQDELTITSSWQLKVNSSKILRQSQSTYNCKVRNPKSKCFNSELYNGDSCSFEYTKGIRSNFNNCFGEIIPDEWPDLVHDKFTPEEVNLIKLRRKLRQVSEISKNIDESDIKAYNAVANSRLLEDMAAHVFRHRNHSSNVRFSIRDFLEGLRWHFLKPGMTENACVAFLYRCAEGKAIAAAKLLERFNLNPDVCDSNGNSGLLYATYNIQHDVVTMLCQYGADMDFFNDNKITPLVLAILKYLTIYHNLNDWNYAFLNIKSDLEDVAGENNYDFNFAEYCDSVFYERDKEFYFHDTLKRDVSTCEIGKLDCRVETVEKFLFNVDLVKEKKEKGEPKEKMRNKTQNRTLQYVDDECTNAILLDIIKMITNLLQLGADPNIGTFPMPPLLMSLFLDTSDLLLLLLEFKADPQVTWEKDNMSALHILVSQSRSSETMYSIGKALIEHGVNLNGRTSNTHWFQEKRRIVGNYTEEEVIDEGKTALHILTLRENLVDGADGYASKLVQLLIKSGASLKMKYLGHTPLSLSVLGGNVNMTRLLLENGAKLDEALGYGMGKVLTIYSLQRYEKSLPKIETCKMILDLLMTYDNPLDPILEFGNVIEFYQAQKTNGPKHKKKKSKVKSSRITIEQYLLKSTCNLILKHYQSIIFLNLLYYAKTSSLDSDFSRKIASFLSFEDAINIVAKLVHKKFIDLNNQTQSSIILQVLQFVATNGFTDKKSRKTMVEDNNVKKMDHLNKRFSATTKLSCIKNSKCEILELLNRRGVSFNIKNAIEPEFDTDFTKYKVCFNCCQRFNKVLLPCPICGLVYFCSEQCNKINNRTNKHHQCKLLYYKQVQKLAQNGVNYFSDGEDKLINGKEIIKLINYKRTFNDCK